MSLFCSFVDLTELKCKYNVLLHDYGRISLIVETNFSTWIFCGIADSDEIDGLYIIDGFSPGLRGNFLKLSSGEMGWENILKNG